MKKQKMIKNLLAYLYILIFSFSVLCGCSDAGAGATSENIKLSTEISSVSTTEEVEEEVSEEDTATGSEEEASSQIVSSEKEDTVSGDGMYVTFLDVGQGNAVLVSCDGKYMLIDGGPSKSSSFVVSYLGKHKVEELDYVIASHYDADHISGLVGVANVYKIDDFLGPDYETDTKTYYSLLDKLQKAGLDIDHPEVGDQYSLGQASFQIISPINYDEDNFNNNSLGIRLVYGDNSFYICGDAEYESEMDMISSGEELKSDVIMASHHGSKNATSEALLRAVSPTYAVISVGKNNSYGHPTEEVLDRLKKQGCTLYRTDTNGTVTAFCDGKSISWSMENEDISSNFLPPEEEEKTADNGENKSGTYILNTHTKKFHNPDCSSVDSMNDSNKESYNGSRQELIKEGYSPCKRCNP